MDLDGTYNPTDGDGTQAESATERAAASEKKKKQIAFLKEAALTNLKRTYELFTEEHFQPPSSLQTCDQLLLNVKARDQLYHVKAIVEAEKRKKGPEGTVDDGLDDDNALMPTPSTREVSRSAGDNNSSLAVVPFAPQPAGSGQALVNADGQTVSLAHRAMALPKPKWHPPWKLTRVVAGHYGWVRCITVEPENQWFATGAADRLIKIWDLATAELKLTLTGHISAVRGLEVSNRMPYLFSCGEDKTVKCWDLEYNKVTRHYHGHLSAVYAISLHPTVDIFVTSGRDSVARVWDIRTKAGVHVLTGHGNTVSDVRCQGAEPQVITGSHDSTVKLWDLRMGRCRATLTHHKKSVRALTIHPTKYMFASASADNIKEWMCPDGKFVQNCSGHNAIINTLACNAEGVMVSGADNGTMQFWDWNTGYCFQKYKTLPQPGSIESEAGIFVCAFDHSGSRLLTGEADKTIKVYKEDESATEETHPVVYKPDLLRGPAKF